MDLCLKQSFFCLAQIKKNLTDFLFCIIITENFNLAITDDRPYGCRRWQDLFSVVVQVKLKTSSYIHVTEELLSFFFFFFFFFFFVNLSLIVFLGSD